MFFRSWIFSSCECGYCCHCFRGTYCLHLQDQSEYGESVFRYIWVLIQHNHEGMGAPSKPIESGQGKVVKLALFHVHCPYWPGWGISSYPLCIGTQDQDLDIHEHLLTILTLTLKMEAGYTFKMSATLSTSTWCKDLRVDSKQKWTATKARNQ
jgi:hypothetical protein